MTTPRQQITIDRPIEQTLANGAQLQCHVEVMWMGRLEEGHIPWMEEQLVAKVKQAIASLDPETLPKQRGQLSRALMEHCEAAGAEHGVQGQVGDLAVRGLEIAPAPSVDAGATMETRQAVRLIDPFRGTIHATAQVVASSEKDAAWAGSRLRGTVEAAVLDFIDDADNLGAHLDTIAREAGRALAPEVAKMNITVVSVQLSHGSLTTEVIPIAEGAATPEASSGGPGLPDLTLEQYASLCVDRQMYPGQEAAIAPRYHVASPQALQQLDQQWQGRLAQDPALHQRFQQACAHYQAWLQPQR